MTRPSNTTVFIEQKEVNVCNFWDIFIFGSNPVIIKVTCLLLVDSDLLLVGFE